ncbi:MAG: hypothetical protein GF370_04500 [Candidatus Nealsonbacteria bacterium]|nr:hypothetical protein [Candidatus Nealsonbacteria bacterium]
MKIAFPTNGKGLDSGIEEHFGRARRFLIYNQETREQELVANPHFSSQDALPPELLGRKGADALVVCDIGKKALEMFDGRGINVYRAVPGNIEENLKKIRQGKLSLVLDSNC